MEEIWNTYVKLYHGFAVSLELVNFPVTFEFKQPATSEVLGSLADVPF